MYSLHRKKAKVIFRKDAVILERLGLTGSLPKGYVKWLEVVKKFYANATDTSIQKKLARLKITKQDINTTSKLITDLDSARSEYLKEKGEDQSATLAKDAAFAKLDDRISEFYAVAKIGLEDNPQLLEAPGKVIRN